MFTKRDYVVYFSEIEQFERNMSDLYSEAARRITNKRVKDVFTKLASAEEIHMNLVAELRRIAIRFSL